MTENLIEIDVLSQNITAIAFLIMVNLDTPVSGGIVLLIKWLCQNGVRNVLHLVSWH